MPDRILIVDDSQVNRVVADASLKDAGMETAQAEHGYEALEMLKLGTADSCPFDAVLLDIMMPEIDGLKVLKKIREVWNPIELPVIMATAKDQPKDIVSALEKGANDYVTKPLDLQILKARMKTHLELRKSHHQLKKAQFALVNAAKMETIGILAAGVAHEIRNPLGRIQMAASGLESLAALLPEKEDRELAEFSTSSIVEAVERADEIVRRLMQASESQQLDLHPVDLEEIVRRGLEMLQAEIEEKGDGLQVDLIVEGEGDEDLPMVLLAEEEFQQAFAAVLKNAIQVATKITLRLEATELSGIGSKEGGRSGNRPRDGDKVVALHVEDNGPGLEKGDIERVFDAFFTTKATGTGTGLGLTVVKKIIDLHQGLIHLENREDVPSGLRVSIYLKTKAGLRTSV